MNYIFGYGSLICADSRNRTGSTDQAFPIEVSGLQRSWSIHTPDWPATAVSINQVANTQCNGVYFAVDDANLAQFDIREQGYDRIEIPWQQVTASCSQPLPSTGRLWAYIGSVSNLTPEPDRPIMHSYLDVILNGCLDFDENFAVRFAQLTTHWQHLVNDRAEPQYLRPIASSARFDEIDQIIKQHLPELWANRKTI